MLSHIYVVGLGLDGAEGLSSVSQSVVERATVLVGSDRHLHYFPNHPAERIPLKNLQTTIDTIHQRLQSDPSSAPIIVILVSGDPLFFGLGRLLLQSFAPDQLTFYPHLSSVQLAFNQIKLPWHDATIVSLHGRPPDELIPLLKKGTDKIALLTDGIHTPEAIAHLIQSLTLPVHYRMWVCENLGGEQERVQLFPLDTLRDAHKRKNQTIETVQQTSTSSANIGSSAFAPLNVVILVRHWETAPLDPETLPLMGISDHDFLSFRDRPSLITKREVRTLILAELQLKPGQVIWDIGAGTGSVSIEISRLNPTATIYAIEKTAVGVHLIQANAERFQTTNIIAIQGGAPEAIAPLPHPDRIFIGGSGGQLSAILDQCGDVLAPDGCMVIAMATLEHQAQVMEWLSQQRQQPSSHRWEHRVLSVHLSRSIPIGPLTRLQPLNPVTIISISRS